MERETYQRVGAVSLEFPVCGKLDIASFEADLSGIGLEVGHHVDCTRLILEFQECLYKLISIHQHDDISSYKVVLLEQVHTRMSLEISLQSYSLPIAPMFLPKYSKRQVGQGCVQGYRLSH